MPWPRLVAVLSAAVALYWAGMILNDVFDVEQDREERPGRPLAAGHISMGQAKAAGWGLLILGVVLAAVSGQLPGETPTTWLPAGVAALLAVMIVAYDGPLKKTPLAPFAMGGCRLLSFLLGASPCVVVADVDGYFFPKYVIAIACGFGLYIAGITTVAKDEAKEPNEPGPTPHVSRGLVLAMIGLAMLAFAPQTAQGNFQWHLSPTKIFPLLIGMIGFPVILRGLRLVNRPTPQAIQLMIRIGILTMIPLAAAFAFLGAGPKYGLAVFSLVVPSILLASRFRVT